MNNQTQQPAMGEELKRAVENARGNVAVRRKCGGDCVWLACDTVDIILSALTPPSANPESVGDDVVERIVEQLVKNGRAERDCLNSEQRAAADDEARTFYRKVVRFTLERAREADAATIATLQAENERLREALEEAAIWFDQTNSHRADHMRAALANQEPK